MAEPIAAGIVSRALAEDLGAGDVTTLATVPESARARALITQKAPGVLFGLAIAEETFRRLDPAWPSTGSAPRASGARGGT